MRRISTFFILCIATFVFFISTSPISFAASPADYGLVEGDLISASGSEDPDIYIVNEYSYKRLFLNPTIFNFYGHLKWSNVRSIAASTRDVFSTSGLFRNCEANDPKVYGAEIVGEDGGLLHWVNVSGDQALADDPDFFKKVFCVNNQEFSWYAKGTSYSSVGQVPQYARAAAASFPTENALFVTLEARKRSPHFTVHFHLADEAIAGQMLQFAEQDYLALRSIFMHEAATEILMTSSGDEYIDVFNASPPWQRDTLREPTSSAGAFCPGCVSGLGDDTDYVYFLRPIAASIAHETAHRFWWAAYPNLRRRDDLHWLNEGVATYAQHEVSRVPHPGGFSSDSFENIIEHYRARGNAGAPQDFSAMNDMLRSSDPAVTGSFHNYHALLVYFLEVRLDDYGLARFLGNLNATQNLDQTFMNLFGMTGMQAYELYKQVLNMTAATSTTENFLGVFRQNAK